MKQNFQRVYLVLFICILLAPMTARAAKTQEATLNNATAQYATDAPIIDGELDKVWDTTPFYYVKHYESTGDMGEQQQNNPIEGSYAKILWDEKAYYLLAVVYDTTLLEAGFTDWNSVDYWISEKNTQEYGWDKDEGDYSYCITDDGTPVSWHGDSTVIENAEKIVQNYEEYYVVEAKIPWQSDVTAKNGHKIGFNVSINDDIDGDGERDAYTYWATDDDGEYWNNTNALAAVELVGQSGIAETTVLYMIVGVMTGVIVSICVVYIILRKLKKKDI